MYDLIQSALTAATVITAIAAHAIWKQHTNWMSAYCPKVAPYTPDTREAEVATSVPQPEPEVAIADPWEAPITTSSRRWVSRQPESIKPMLALCPAKEVKPVTKPQPTQIDLNALDAVALRKLCSQYKIQWRDVRGKNRHATKSMMIFQLNQKAVA